MVSVPPYEGSNLVVRAMEAYAQTRPSWWKIKSWFGGNKSWYTVMSTADKESSIHMFGPSNWCTQPPSQGQADPRLSTFLAEQLGLNLNEVSAKKSNMKDPTSCFNSRLDLNV